MSTAMKTGVLMMLDLITILEGTGMSTAMKTGAMMAGAMTITEERTTEMANGAHPGISQYLKWALKNFYGLSSRSQIDFNKVYRVTL